MILQDLNLQEYMELARLLVCSCQVYYTTSPDGKWSGGKHLPESAAYTAWFCRAVLKAWLRHMARHSSCMLLHALTFCIIYIHLSSFPFHPFTCFGNGTALARISILCAQEILLCFRLIDFHEMSKHAKSKHLWSQEVAIL